MATLYWGGGAGTWNSSSATNWYTDAGRTTPASAAPTSADDVDFASASNATAYTVTIGTGAVCNNWTVAGPASGNVNFGGSGTLTVYGSTTFASTGIGAPAAGSTYTITFAATTSVTLKGPNAINLALGAITFDGVGGTWTLTGALTSSSTITLTNGTLNTSASNYGMAILGFASNNSNTRTLTLNGSSITCFANACWTASATLTLNAGTSTISVSPGSPTFTGAGLTYYNVSFTSNALVFATITGANTYNNLSFTARAATGLGLISIGNDFTVSGTLTINSGATDPTRRTRFYSSTPGTQRTVTAAAISLTCVDFIDINAAGAAAAPNWDLSAAATYAGNGTGNSNITFPTAKTVYWNLAGSQNWTATAWCTSSDGGATLNAANAANYPLGQDTAVLNEVGSAGTITVAISNTLIGTLDFSPRTATAVTFATGTSVVAYVGDLSLSSQVTISGTGAFQFVGRGVTQSITSAGKTFTQPFTINSFTGTARFADNTTLSNAITLTSGTLSINGKTVSITSFASTGTITRALTFGTSGIINISASGASAWSASGSGLTTTGTTSKISMTSASAKTFAGGGFNYAATLDQGGAGALTVSGSNTFADITSSYTATGAATITFTAGTTQTVSQFTASGTSGKLLTLNSSSAGSQFTLSDASGTNSVSYCDIKDSIATGGASWQAYTTNGNINSGNNTGWSFNAPVVYSYSSTIALRSLAQRGRF